MKLEVPKGSVSVVDRARLYLQRCPPAVSGQHGHDATFHVASVLWNGFGLSEGETLMLLTEYSQRCIPHWTEAELIHKVRSVANAHHNDPRGHLLNGDYKPQHQPTVYPRHTPFHRAVKPVFRPMVLKRIAAKATNIPDPFAYVRERSPVAVQSLTSAGFLQCLYPMGSGEKVLLFSQMRSQGQFLWATDAKSTLNKTLPVGPDGVWFLAQPVDGQFHPNPRLGGKTSRRSEESVTAWRYAVVESDEADPSDWLRCLIQMPLRIASICESGGRSIHALVRIDAASKQDWDTQIRAIKPVLVTLGADRGALSAVQLTRLPQALRGERVQRLLYLNPTPAGVPILNPSSDRPASTKGSADE